MSYNNNKPRWGGGGGGPPGGGGGRKYNNLPTPKNPANQAAWDRLKERYDNAKSDNYEYTISKAIRSLAASKEPILTYKDAMALANVGKHCAGLICPPLETGEAAMVAKPQGRGKKKTTAKTKNITDAFAEQQGEAPPARVPKSQATAKPSKETAPSAKELLYQKEKKTAIEKWSHPISSSSHASGLVWKVVLLVDNREQKSEHILSKCSMSGIPAEERVLPIGDMTWVAQGLRKHRIQGKTTTVMETEVLLGTIIERKTTEDFVASFIGTRYNEQRLRLKNAGQPQVLYLIEGDIQRDVHPCIPKDRVQMALIETRIEFGFQIVFTTHMDDTVKTLKNFHRRILQRAFPDAFGITDDALPSFASPEAAARRAQPQPTATAASHRRRKRNPTSLVEMTFDSPPVPAFGESRFITYDELKAKIERDREAGTRTVGAIHCAMLRQICGNKQVQSIVQDYPTPSSLLQAYDAVAGNPKHQSELLVNCCTDSGGNSKAASRRVGPKVSSEVYFAYCSKPHQSKRQYGEIEEESTAMLPSKKPAKKQRVQPAEATEETDDESTAKPSSKEPAKKPSVPAAAEEVEENPTAKPSSKASAKKRRLLAAAAVARMESNTIFKPANDKALKPTTATAKNNTARNTRPTQKSSAIDSSLDFLLSSDDDNDAPLNIARSRDTGKENNSLKDTQSTSTVKKQEGKSPTNAVVLLDDSDEDNDINAKLARGGSAERLKPGATVCDAIEID